MKRDDWGLRGDRGRSRAVCGLGPRPMLLFALARAPQRDRDVEGGQEIGGEGQGRGTLSVSA